jgi:hypothetical protein
MSRRTQHLLSVLSEMEPPAHLKSVKQRLRAGANLSALKTELMREIAASLGRAERHVTEALSELDAIASKIATLEPRAIFDRDARSELFAAITAFNVQRARAEVRRWELLVQREAMGLRRHDLLEAQYPLPPPRKLP